MLVALWLSTSAAIQLIINDNAGTCDGATFDNGPGGLDDSLFSGEYSKPKVL